MLEAIKIGGTMPMEKLMLGIFSSRSRDAKSCGLGEGIVDVRAD